MPLRRGPIPLLGQGRKPPLGSSVDWGHPLAVGLAAAFLINEDGGVTIWDAATGLSYAGVNSPTRAAQGIALAAGSSQYIPTRAINSTTITLAARMSIPTGTTYAIINRDYDGTNVAYGVDFIPAGFFPGFHFFNGTWRYSGLSVDLRGTGFRSVAGSYDGAALRSWVDGRQDSSSAYAGTLPSSSNVLDIGRYAGNSWYSTYTLEYLYVYTRALSAGEIAALHADPYAHILPPAAHRGYFLALSDTPTPPITRRQSASATATASMTTTGLSVTLASAPVSGNVLLATFSTRGGTNRTITPPANWTLISNTRTNGSTQIAIAVYKKTAGAGESATQGAWTLDTANSHSALTIQELEGADPATITGYTGATGSSTAPSASASSLTSADAHAVLASYAVNTATSMTPPSDMIEAGDVSTSGGSNITQMVATDIFMRDVTSTTRTATAASGTWVATLVTVKPTAAAAAQRTVPVSAALTAVRSRTVPTTAALAASRARTVPVSAILSRTAQRTVPASAALTATRTRSVPTTAVLIATRTRSVPTTAALAVARSRTVPTSAALSAARSRTVPTTAVTSRTAGRTVPVTAVLESAIVGGTFERAVAVSAVLIATRTRTVPTTAVLIATRTRTVPVTAALAGTKSRAVPTSAALSAARGRTVPTTAILVATRSRSVPVSAVITATRTRTVPASAIFTATRSRTVPTSAALAAARTRTIPTTAALAASRSRSVPTSAIFVATRSRSVPVSAVLIATRSRTAPVSAALAATRARTVPTAATFAATRSRSVPTTAIFVGTRSRSVPVTAVIETPPGQRIVPVSAALAGARTRTIPASAALAAARSRTVPTTAALAATRTRTVPTTAAVQRTRERTIPVSAALQTTRQRAVPVSAVIGGGTFARTIPATAVLARIRTRTIPVSAVLSGGGGEPVAVAITDALAESLTITDTLTNTVSLTVFLPGGEEVMSVSEREYLPGQRVRLQFTFTDEDGDVADPDTPAAQVMDPEGEIAVISLSQVSTGVYKGYLDIAIDGDYLVRGTADDTLTGAEEHRLRVRRSAFV